MECSSLLNNACIFFFSFDTCFIFQILINHMKEWYLQHMPHGIRHLLRTSFSIQFRRVGYPTFHILTSAGTTANCFTFKCLLLNQFVTCFGQKCTWLVWAMCLGNGLSHLVQCSMARRSLVKTETSHRLLFLAIWTFLIILHQWKHCHSRICTGLSNLFSFSQPATAVFSAVSHNFWSQRINPPQ